MSEYLIFVDELKNTFHLNPFHHRERALYANEVQNDPELIEEGNELQSGSENTSLRSGLPFLLEEQKRNTHPLYA